MITVNCTYALCDLGFRLSIIMYAVIILLKKKKAG